MRYILFGGKQYYPQGGIADYLYSADDLQDILTKLSPDWDSCTLHVDIDGKSATGECLKVGLPEMYVSDTLNWWHIFDVKHQVIVISFGVDVFAYSELFTEDRYPANIEMISKEDANYSLEGRRWISWKQLADRLQDYMINSSSVTGD